MKVKTSYILLAVVGIALIVKFGLYLGGMLSLVCGLVGYFIAVAIRQELLERSLKGKWEDIFVVTRHPDTDEEIDLGELNEFVVWVAYGEAHREAERLRELLRKVNNDAFCNEDYSEDERMKVHVKIFKSGEHINERFGIQFRTRLISDIKEARKRVHTRLKRDKPDWYKVYGDHQKGYLWEKT